MACVITTTGLGATRDAPACAELPRRAPRTPSVPPRLTAQSWALVLIVLTSGACDRPLAVAPTPHALPTEIEQQIRAARHEGIVEVSWEADPATGRRSVRVLGLVKADSRLAHATVPGDIGDGTLASMTIPATQDWPTNQLNYRPPVAPAGGRYTFYANNTYPTEEGLYCSKGGVITTITSWRVDSLVQRARFDDATGALTPTGGHGAAHRTPKPIGSWSPRSGTPNPATNTFRSTYTSERAAGDEWRIRYYRLTDRNDPCYMGLWDDEGSAGREMWCRMAVRFTGLARQQETTYLYFDNIGSDHDDLYYLTPLVKARTELASEAYYNLTSSLPGGAQRVRMNASSLKFGGINDVNNNWNPSHHLHRVGWDVDIDDARGDSPTTHRLLARAFQERGFRLCARHGPSGQPPNHVHCHWRLPSEYAP